MKFISTRGEAQPIGFEDVLLSGPAPDGGLYVPETWPHISQAEFAALSGKPYAEIVAAVIAKFADRDWADQAARIAREVYPRFTSPDVAPLVDLATLAQRRDDLRPTRTDATGDSPKPRRKERRIARANVRTLADWRGKSYARNPSE